MAVTHLHLKNDTVRNRNASWMLTMSVVIAGEHGLPADLMKVHRHCMPILCQDVLFSIDAVLASATRVKTVWLDEEASSRPIAYALHLDLHMQHATCTEVLRHLCSIVRLNQNQWPAGWDEACTSADHELHLLMLHLQISAHLCQRFLGLFRGSSSWEAEVC